MGIDFNASGSSSGMSFPNLVAVIKGYAVNKSVDQKRIKLHEREVVVFEEQLQILPIMTGSFKPYLLFAIEGIKQLLEQRKPLAVILERPRGCDDIAKLINNGAVVLEF